MADVNGDGRPDWICDIGVVIPELTTWHKTAYMTEINLSVPSVDKDLRFYEVELVKLNRKFMDGCFYGPSDDYPTWEA